MINFPGPRRPDTGFPADVQRQLQIAFDAVNDAWNILNGIVDSSSEEVRRQVRSAVESFLRIAMQIEHATNRSDVQIVHEELVVLQSFGPDRLFGEYVLSREKYKMMVDIDHALSAVRSALVLLSGDDALPVEVNRHVTDATRLMQELITIAESVLQTVPGDPALTRLLVKLVNALHLLKDASSARKLNAAHQAVVELDSGTRLVGLYDRLDNDGKRRAIDLLYDARAVMDVAVNLMTNH